MGLGSVLVQLGKENSMRAARRWSEWWHGICSATVAVGTCALVAMVVLGETARAASPGPGVPLISAANSGDPVPPAPPLRPGRPEELQGDPGAPIPDLDGR